MESAIRERVEHWFAKRRGEDGEDANGASSSASGKDEEMMKAAGEEMVELILDGRQFKSVGEEAAALLQKLTVLGKLTCNQTGLHSIEGFPVMPSVKTLELTDNHISGGLEALVKSFPNIKRLQLGGNYFRNFEVLEPLKGLGSLEHLGLDMSPISNQSDYRQKVFEMFPRLLVLDSTDKDGKEVEAADSDEEDEEEYDDDEEADTTLKDFYEKDLEDEDEEDEDDFNPDGEEEEDEDFDEEEEEDGIEGDGAADGEEEDAKDADGKKRKNDAAVSGEGENDSAKHPRLS
ncbi:putative inhibitor-1 of protein phosphatase type 2A [Neospora caninum Liverpool]|uniref:Inhibitor-1 of protein phosphatase type 2A,putative n=1 Tax=Neospora caninum (strain Liverpool) TaxID=572307 RepID=F0VJ38_NEOCL|nr:putative inhibitor-1 of protein phosphatase type 2A [Neospora caninum Liverpool]CBZ53749.1 putative inhibitor-1 of protein phosphatase type 2A [Neospora caninum Liverpool]CEL67741.1 TPA: inhibitor-1 of protein phosphatase type 2A,putative [Neospora caninum Liverpool]|eukprot:XP_003883781.1 putative inhibitor-1 of protein phosphatase type 2A [Neospora caninum Liverpool]